VRALRLDVGDQPPERRGQSLLPLRIRAEDGAASEPRVELEPTTLADARDELDEASAGDEERRRHTGPEQHHHRKSEDLPERKESILENRQQAQPRLHNEYAPPAAIATAASATVHTGSTSARLPS
jgi:hypothetical protein